jgi:phospholipase C
MSKTDQFTRRAALKLGLGVGALAVGLDACGTGADRCPPGPVATGAAPGLLSGIDTIVVVMMENRSFDHLLGGLGTDPS